MGLKIRNSLRKPGQTLPATGHGVLAQVAFAVQTVALAHGFLDVLHPPQLARIHLTDFEAKTVGAQVDGGVQRMGLHGVGGEGGRAKC